MASPEVLQQIIFWLFGSMLKANWTNVGITAAIVPGILPVTNFKTVARFSAACGTAVPEWMAELFEGLDDDPETRALVAASASSELCLKLMGEGVDEFHFYTLNRAELTNAICRRLGVRPEMDQAA